MSLYSEEDDGEFISHRRVEFDKHTQILIKSFVGRIRSAHTLQALLAVRHDIQQSPLTNNAAAKDELRREANRQAHDAGFKPAHEGERWWT